MNGVACCLAVVWAIASLEGVPVQRENTESVAGEWVRAVEQHRPGEIDPALLAIAGWTGGRLEQAIDGLRDYLLVARAGNRALANDVLARGALLHTDIAMLAPDRARRFRGFSTWPARSGIRGLDGENRGDEIVSGHWELARVLVDQSVPAPANVSFARNWYIAVAAYLHREGLLAIAVQHLARARQVLRGDAEILFLSGALHEAFASPRLQSVVRASFALTRQRIAVDGSAIELRRAERYFRDALREKPELLEARVHLGRTLAELGRHEEAAAELRAVSADLGGAGEPILEYYTQLFLGHEEALVGRGDAARAAFEAAHAADPGAQSAAIALSELARSRGDRREALKNVRAIATLDTHNRRDPWWIYTIAHGRNAAALLADLRAPYLLPGTGARR